MIACTYYYRKDMAKTVAYMTQQKDTVQRHNYLVVGEIFVLLMSWW